VAASLIDGVGYAGGGALPMSEVPSKVIRLEVRGFTASGSPRHSVARAHPWLRGLQRIR